MAVLKSVIWFATLLCALINGVSSRPWLSCPVECKCFYQDSKWITDCSEFEFTTIPTRGLSEDTAVFILNGNRIRNIDTSLADSSDHHYTNLRSLKLSKNLLTRIQPKMFAGLRLNELDVSSNFITHIDPEAFIEMDTLHLLRLKDNSLKPVEGPFIKSSSLYELYIENCDISHLSPQFFTKLGALEKVDLSGNPLQIIKPVVFDPLRNLNTLSLNKCNLTYIHPEAFKGLVNLQMLEIEENSFANYVDWSLVLRPLTKLWYFSSVKSSVTNFNNDTFNSNNNHMRIMSLAENDLSNLNLSSFGKHIPNLIYLDLSYCNIKGPLAEDTFVNTKELLVLKLSGNRLFNTHLAVAISSLTKLYTLSLRDSGLIMLPNNTFNKMTSLKHLDISRNPLGTANEIFLSPLTSLKKLDLSYSEFKIIKNTMFSELSKLKKLILSGNKIINIEKGSFKNLKSLEILELSDCGLGSLMRIIFYDEDESINLIELKLSENPLQMPVTGSLLPRKLPNLVSLDMSKCNLTFVSPDFFISTPKIKQLFLNNNKIRNYEHTLSFMDILNDIELLDLSFNRMKAILPNQLMHNNQLTSLRLYGNPWSCNCDIVDVWDWAASIKIGWLDGAVKSNSNETNNLICFYDPNFPLAEKLLKHLVTLPGQPHTKAMTWEKFVFYSDCPWKTKAARSILSRVTREVHEEQEETLKTEKGTTILSIIQSVCFILLIIIVAFVLVILVYTVLHYL